jgi:hypothetical protein
MAFEPVAAIRSRLETIPTGVEIRIPVRRHIFPLIFLPVWLVGWALGLVAVAGSFLRSGTAPGGQLFTLVWLTLWVIGGTGAFTTWLWMLAGAEVLRVAQGAVTLERSLLLFRRRKQYNLKLTQNWRTVPQPANGWARQESWYPLGFGSGGTLAFDYGAKTIYLARGIDEAEASQLLAQLRTRGLVPASAGAA